MKIILLLFLVLIFFSGCEEKEDIEIIPNYDEIYLPIRKLDSTPQLIKGNEKELSERINSEIKRTGSDKDINLVYLLYIDEQGEVKKVMVGSSPDKKYTGMVVKEFESWIFEPGKKDGKPVKSQYMWKFNLANSYADKNFNKEDYYVAVNEMPEPIGGLKAILEKLHYPEIAKRAGVEGKVYVLAFIDEEGNVVSAEIIKGVGSGLNEAAVKAVMETKFTPAKQNGKSVKVQVTVPIIFKL